MSNFIRTDNCLLNLDYVVKVVQSISAETGCCRVTFIGVNAEVLGSLKQFTDDIYLECLGKGQMIPAQSGFNALVRTEGTYEVSPVPVIGWCVDGSGTRPALCADGSQTHNVIQWPDGQVFDGNNSEFFPNREDYVAWLRVDEESEAKAKQSSDIAMGDAQ